MQQTYLSLPDFSAISIDAIEGQLEALLDRCRHTISELELIEQPDWQNFAIPLQETEMNLEDFWSPVSHLNGVMNSDELREVYQRGIAMLTDYSTEVGQNQALFRVFNNLKISDGYTTYSQAQQQWVDKALLDFHLSGVDLEGEKKLRFKAIKARLAELTQQFSNNVLDATDAWKKHITDKSDLTGLPDAMLEMFAQAAAKKDKEGYLVGLDFPSYYAVVTYAENRELRKELYLAYMTKASDHGPDAGKFDNSDVMVEVLKLRQEMAELLGYKHYAERSLVTKMADSAEEVIAFLEDLATRSRPFAEKDLAQLQAYARDEFGLETLKPWDVSFVSEKYQQQHFNISDEQLREYFPVEKVLSGMFTVVERLYDITIKQQEDVSLYHEDARFYNIYSADRHIASFYLDLYARDKKRGGAWMADCRSRWQLPDGNIQIPIAFLTCNFRPPSENKPALLGHTEVTTLFHEFGHGLHHMLTQETVAGVSGIAGVEWDAVELPSQFMENWCWQKEAIKLISEHYETGEPLPDEMLGNMLAAKNFNAGMMMARQLEFSLFDILLHCRKDISKANDIQTILNNVRQQVAVIIPPDEVRFQHGFSHIFAGGYAAGYYSYKWAEVLSADAFSLFEENGLFDEKTGKRFLKNILQVGSSRPAAESFQAFRGREPKVDALLRHNGLSEAA